MSDKRKLNKLLQKIQLITAQISVREYTITELNKILNNKAIEMIHLRLENYRLKKEIKKLTRQ